MTNSVSKIVEHGFFANIFWREHYFYKKGDKHSGHTHDLDHATIIIKGSIEVKIENEEPYSITAPAVIEIAKEKLHEFTALEDGSIYMCVFATNEYGDTLMKMSKEEKEEFLKKVLCKDCEGCSSIKQKEK